MEYVAVLGHFLLTNLHHIILNHYLKVEKKWTLQTLNLELFTVTYVAKCFLQRRNVVHVETVSLVSEFPINPLWCQGPDM